MTVRATNVDGDWFVEASGFPGSLNGALGHWLAELGATDVDSNLDGVRARIKAPEPITGALTWLEEEIDNGRPAFEALGIAATHITAAEERPGYEVLLEATGQKRTPENTAPESSADSTEDPEAGSRLESIGSAGAEDGADARNLSPADSQDTAPTSRSRLEPIGGSTAAEPAGRSRSEEEPSEQFTQMEVAPPHRRAMLEPIGYDPEVLQAKLEASVAAADELPEADAEGAFDLYLTDPGPDDRRTAAMLAAALGVSQEEATQLCGAVPALAGSALAARDVRRVDAIVRPATGARFRADPV